MMFYEQQTNLPENYIREKIREFLYEDIPTTDVTTMPIVSKNEIAFAHLQAEDDLIFAGKNILPYFFNYNSSVKINYNDGEFVSNGKIIAEISAPAYLLLTRERVMLNLIQRLCGIATMTKKYAEIAAPFNVKILDTRKTMPGLRLFEKYAVSAAGGFNHRMDLSSGILIKDNHIKAAGSITNAINRIKEMNYHLPIEIEVENFQEIDEALAAGTDGFLLDNMPPETVAEAVKKIRKYINGSKIFIEASGGINLSNLSLYVQTGIDAISTGAITHSVKNSNIHLEFV